MALQASGPISLADLAAEFADTAPYSMSEFYRDGGKVTGNNTNVPTSGAIGLGNFYNAARQIALTIASNVSDLNLRTWALANGWDGSAPLIVTLNSGIWISGSVAGNSTAALTIDGSFPAGVTFINNGTVAGRGGVGGSGASAAAGQAGGRAMLVQSAVSIQNNGTIAGGGGGGGGGAGRSGTGSCSMGDDQCTSAAAGGGGGGGRSNASFSASGGAGGTWSGSGSTGCFGTNGTAGGTGTSSGAGGGGSAANIPQCTCLACEITGGAGGSGGGWGAAGSAGATTAVAGGAGGAAGQAVSGDGNVTWQSLGTILGARV